MRSLLPPEVAVSECFGDPAGAELFPGEAEAIARAVDKRRREYTTVRHCARQALAELGVAPAAIGNGKNREPLWPAGIVGAMTHCDGYRAAAVARANTLASLGIDAEPHLPLPDRIRDTVLRPEEVPHLQQLADLDPGVHWERVLFSAKESVYKAWFPLARDWLGFEDATLTFDAAGGTFTARLHKTGLRVGDRALDTVRGRWRVADGLILTCVTIPPDQR